MVRIVLPQHLRELARTGRIVELAIERPATLGSVLGALEQQYPMLRGAIRDHVTHERRPLVRFFACEEDISHNDPEIPLPAEIGSGEEPLFIVGAIAGGG